MLSTYIKHIARRLARDRQSTILNLAGLASGLACTFLIYLWVSDERSVDKFNEKDSQLYLVIKNSPNSDGTVFTSEHTPGLLADAMKADLPEVEDAVSVKIETHPGVATYNGKSLKAREQFADKDFFNLFSYRLLDGKRTSLLAGNYGVLISDKLARALFNTTDNLIGKTIAWNNNDKFDGSYAITGVYEAPPANATDQFDLLFSYDLFKTKESGTYGDVTDWGSNSIHTYLLLKKGTDIPRFNAKVKDFTQKKVAALYHNKEMSKYEGTLYLQKYSDRYLYNHFENGIPDGGRIEYIQLFLIIALFILVIACINFMNLSTARAATRIKEVGIRKVIGAGRWRLLGQYIGESMGMAFLALILALVLVRLLLPAFNQLTGKDMGLHLTPGLAEALTGITLVTGLVAGSYPAWYLSGFKPVLVLKGKLSNTASESWVRRGLVVFQFSVSVVLIISVMVVYKQMDFIQHRNLGYDRDNVLHFHAEGNLVNSLPAFLTAARQLPGVVGASSMDGNMTGMYSQSGGGISWPGKLANDGVEFDGLDLDYGMIDMLGLQMKEGRAFSPQYPADTNGIIFNETAIAAMKLKNPIGQTVTTWRQQKTIIGVVKDFQFHSMYKGVTPFFLRWQSQGNSDIYIKIKGGTEQETLAKLGHLYQQFNRGLPFEYAFLDADYQALYASEERVSILSRYFAGITILISCLGLFGLAAYTAQRRQKEMSIRKVVGAKASTIALLLSKEFFTLVSVALAIGIPLAAWIMHRWLESFAFRVTMGPAVFILAALVLMVITLLTISYQAIRSASVNPVRVLRSE